MALPEREVARLREQVALTASDAAAARVLAAGADHDVAEVRAELRAHTQALNTANQYLGAYVSNRSSVMATAVLASVPAVALLLVAQRFVAGGLSDGAVR